MGVPNKTLWQETVGCKSYFSSKQNTYGKKQLVVNYTNYICYSIVTLKVIMKDIFLVLPSIPMRLSCKQISL